jgi:hypothetical protein
MYFRWEYTIVIQIRPYSQWNIMCEWLLPLFRILQILERIPVSQDLFGLLPTFQMLEESGWHDNCILPLAIL